MKKTILVLGLALALAACGGDDANETANAPATDAAPAAQPATDPAATAAQPATQPGTPDHDPYSKPVADEAAFWAKFDRIAADAHREESRARDVYRHPKETLQFFGLKPGMRVIEITPGGGWYTELLAPLMRGNGKLVVAIWDDQIQGQPQYRYDSLNRFKTKLWNTESLYDQVEVELFTPPQEMGLGAPNSADMVVTFRNVHNWIGDKSAEGVFKAAFDVLKPGGVLGVTEHRAAAGKTIEETFESGYLSEDAVIKLAEGAGFKLEAKSEINANPKDTKDHPRGVWTLPPTLALGDQDRQKYLDIGESDRMTLKFVKPAQ